MGLSQCSGQLQPDNYPPIKRHLRKPFDSNMEFDTGVGRYSRPRTKIHVMSYNLLADGLDTADKGHNQSPEILDFKFRSPRIISEIAQSDASLICLQEVNHIDDFYDTELKNLGYNIIYVARDQKKSDLSEPHTIAIAYKSDEWVLIDDEQIDLNQVRRWFSRDSAFPSTPNSNAMLCLLQNQQSQQTIVVGNTHFEYRPQLDHVKYAQAAYMIERCAKYISDNKGGKSSLPFVCGGDFNSLPFSSALSAWYGENIENPESRFEAFPSQWEIPANTDESMRSFYHQINQVLQRKIKSGVLDPLAGQIRSAYECYELPVGRVPSDQTLTRQQTMPLFTHFKESFQGTLDHIFYNKDLLEVKSILDIPDRNQIVRDRAIPSLSFPSDHFRIEAEFTLK